MSGWARPDRRMGLHLNQAGTPTAAGAKQARMPNLVPRRLRPSLHICKSAVALNEQSDPDERRP